MTLVCLAFLISLHSRLPPSLTLAVPRPSSLLLPVLRSFSFLSVCLGVLSLIRAFGPSWRPTPLNSSMCALHLHCLFTALTPSVRPTMLHSADVNASFVAACFCICRGVFFWLGLCLLSPQSVHVDVDRSCHSVVYIQSVFTSQIDTGRV